MNAKEFAQTHGKGSRNAMLIEVFGYQFYIYADETNHDTGPKHIFFHFREKDSQFENTIDFSPQFRSMDRAIKHIEKELSSVVTNIFSQSEKPKRRAVEKKRLEHELFTVGINVAKLGDDDIIALEWEIGDAGMNIWKDPDIDKTALGGDNTNFPILVWDDAEWCLSAETTQPQVDPKEFTKLTHDCKESK